MDFVVPVDHRVKIKENGKKDKYLNLARVLRKLWNIRGMVIPIVVGMFGTVSKGFEMGELLIRIWTKMNPDYNIVKIGQNIEKSPRYLKRLADSQTPMKDHQLTLAWKTHKE